MGHQADDHPFWCFSLRRYARQGVAPLCLAVQDETGADVNLLLFGMWIGSEGDAVHDDGAQRAAEVVADWHEKVVRPLRGVRRWLKGNVTVPAEARDRLREAVQAWEIESERLEQDMLFGLHSRAPAALIHSPTPAPAPQDRAQIMTDNAALLILAQTRRHPDRAALAELARLCL